MSGSYSFAQVPTADIPRSVFNRSHSHKTTFNAGKLIPFFVDEALPGDTYNVHAGLFARLATPIFPLMDNMHLDVFFFAVPNRLVWDNWQRFMGEQNAPDDNTEFVVPEVESGEDGFAVESLFDYMGLPVNVPNIKCSALFPRAYNLIWNEWFRDENLQEPVNVPKLEGPDSAESFNIMRRGKRHDYFTSCMPWPQKGPGVELPVGGTIPVSVTSITGTGSPTFSNGNFGPRSLETDTQAGPAIPTVTLGHVASAGAYNADPLNWADPKLVGTGVGDLSSATAVTINALREAFQIQRLLERDARGGTRYIEILRAHFGVVSPDARLQRPEYLGGGSIPIIINPVTQTSQSTTGAGGSPQGNMAAYGVAAGKGIGFTKSFVEHCVIVGLVAVRADLSYQQGLPRMFSRKTRYDFYWPAFANLGEQAVLNKEIYCQGPAVPGVVDPDIEGGCDAEVFGYQERWAEYRYAPSKVTGKFRVGIPGGDLGSWHLAQEFTALPTLSDTFIQDNPPVERVVAVTTEPHFLFDSKMNVACTRPMPTYSVPGFGGRF